MMICNDLTVIIPSFARQVKLERAIGSILSQDLQPAEVIIVDDASPEKLIVPPVFAASGRVRLLRLANNAGPGKGRNAGIAAAHTSWISFLDSDDWLLPGSLRRRWLYLQEEENRSLMRGKTLYGCGWQDVMTDGTVLHERIPLAPKSPSDFFRGCWFSPGSCIIFNQETLLKQVRNFDESLRRLEDYEWFVRIGLAGFSLKIQDYVGVAVERGNNTNFRAVAVAAQLISRRISDLTTDRRLRKIADGYLFYERAASAWREGRLMTFGGMLLRSFVASPRLTLSPAPGWQIRPAPAGPISHQ